MRQAALRFFFVQSFAGALRILFLIAIAISVLPNGSVGEAAYYTSATLHSLIFALTALLPIRNPVTRRLYRATIVTCACLAIYVAAQAVSFQGNPLANPAWETAASIVGESYSSISIAPWRTIAALPALIVPLFVFANAIILHQGDHDARAFWRNLALFSATLAIIALVRHHLFPQAALFGVIAQEEQSLSGNFYNRNNASAFLALSAFAIFGLLCMQLTEIHLDSVKRRLRELRFFDSRRYVLVLVYALLFLICLIALFLTRSRGGVGFSTLCLMISAIVIVLTYHSASAGLAFRLPLSIAILLGSVIAFGIFGGRVVLRAEVDGFDEARWCTAKSMLRAISDYPLFGTGFGTFREFFPIYRDIQCGIYGVWERAHNSFLEAYLGLGFPSALFMLACAVALIHALRIGYLERRRFRSVAIVTFGAVVYVMLHSVWDFPLQIHGIAVYFAALTGAGCSISVARRGDRSSLN